MIPEVSLLGSWQPATSEERLDRLESLAAIHQLAVRYALAVDSRDLETLVSLFAADVTVGKDRKGREALKVWFARILKGMRVSVHFVGNHVIDFDDPDHARGIVYCQDELERPATGQWQQGKIQYWDDYCRVEDRWYFTRRRFNRWYLVDALERPSHGGGVNVGYDPLPATLLPDGFQTWDTFWAEP
jgi:SnoaL-like domain